MILATSTPRLKRSPYPFAPLSSAFVPGRLRMASIDYALTGAAGVDTGKAIRIMSDLEQRAEQDHDHLIARALTYAGALGKIDALHIEWGSTDPMQVDQLWERLGAILREAGI